jgi:hypothetical protein
MRHHAKLWALAALVAISTVGTAWGFALRGSVVGNGATPSAGITGGGKIMRGTVGQAAVGMSGNSSRILCHGFWCSGGSGVVAVDPPPGGPALPQEIAFSHPRPNPARNHVSFELALPTEADVSLVIDDLLGRRVETMVDRTLSAGYHMVRWDDAEAGGSGGSGVYFARLFVDGRPLGMRRIVMLR